MIFSKTPQPPTTGIHTLDRWLAQLWRATNDGRDYAQVLVTDADVTLSVEEARAWYVDLSGVLSGNRSVIVPDRWHGTVFCNNTGAFTTTIKTAAGSGIVVAQTKRAQLLADGTNVVRTGPDT